MELHNLASLTQNLNMTRLFRGVALVESNNRLHAFAKTQFSGSFLSAPDESFWLATISSRALASMTGNLPKTRLNVSVSCFVCPRGIVKTFQMVTTALIVVTTALIVVTTASVFHLYETYISVR
jgi:hypothetical protein